MANLVGQVDLQAVSRALQGPNKPRSLRNRPGLRLALLKPEKGPSGPKKGEVRVDQHTGSLTAVWNGRRWITVGVASVKIAAVPKKSKKSPPPSGEGKATIGVPLNNQTWCLRTLSKSAYCHSCRKQRVQTTIIISPNGAWLQRCESCGECDAVGLLVLKKRRVKGPLVDNLVERNARLPKEVLKDGKFVEPTIGEVRPTPLGGVEIYDGHQWQRAKVKPISPKGIAEAPPPPSFEEYERIFKEDEWGKKMPSVRTWKEECEDIGKRGMMKDYDMKELDQKQGGWF